MYSNLIILTQSAIPILPLALVKEQIRQDATVNTIEDMIIGVYLASAAKTCESYLKLTLATKQYKLIMDYFPGSTTVGTGHPGLNYSARNIGGLFTMDSFRLPMGPLQTVDNISYNSVRTGMTTVNPSVYAVVPGLIGRVGSAYGQIFPFTYGWSIGQIGSVAITFTSGYGVPDPVTGLLNVMPPNITAAILLLTSHLYKNREASAEGSMSVIPFGVKELLDVASPGFYR